MKTLLDADVRAGDIKAVARVVVGFLEEKKYYFITDVEELREWLSKSDIWGDPETINAPKSLDDLRNNRKMKNKKGVCIISKSGDRNKNGYATLWTGNDMIGGHDYLGKDCVVYFWSLKSIASGENVCKFCDNQVADGSVLCESHKAKDRNDPRIIEECAYNSLDDAAMTAANIIIEHISIDDKVEYGIGIYGNEDAPQNQKYHLVETRLGKTTGGIQNVLVDDEIKESGRKFNGQIYSFKAHVHSHPIHGIQEFSAFDCILACGARFNSMRQFSNFRSPYTMFLVGSAWLPDSYYNENDIVTWGSTLWLARLSHLADVHTKPSDSAKEWTRVKDRNEINNAHNGCATLTRFTPPMNDIEKLHDLGFIMAFLFNSTIYKGLKEALERLGNNNWAAIKYLVTQYDQYFAERTYLLNLKDSLKERFPNMDILVYGYGGRLERAAIIEKFNNTEVRWQDIRLL